MEWLINETAELVDWSSEPGHLSLEFVLLPADTIPQQENPVVLVDVTSPTLPPELDEALRQLAAEVVAVGQERRTDRLILRLEGEEGAPIEIPCASVQLRRTPLEKRHYERIVVSLKECLDFESRRRLLLEKARERIRVSWRSRSRVPDSFERALRALGTDQG